MLSEMKKDVFLCVCVCLIKMKPSDVEYLLEIKKKTLCEGGYSL